MNVKLNRESILVILMSLMILVGAFYYGNIYLIDSVKEDAEILTDTVRGQKILMDNYPPEESLKTEYEEALLEKESFLPLGNQATQEFVRLEELANQTNVSISSVSRNSVDQAISDVPNHFVKTVYTVQVSSDSATNLRNLVERLMSEERVWNIPTFTYSRSGEGSYSGSFTYELPYYTTEPEPEETVEEVSEDEESDDGAEG